MKRLSWCLTLALLGASGALSLGVGQAAAAPGSLDPGFGKGGILAFARNMAPEEERVGEDMAVGPEDGIFVLYGSSSQCFGFGDCSLRLTVRKLLPNGGPNSSFGTAGSSGVDVVLPSYLVSSFSRGWRNSLAVTPDGKPVVAAYDEGDVALIRFDRDGQLDPGFGGTGRVRVDLGGTEVDPEVAVQPDGSLVVVAYSRRGSEPRSASGLGKRRSVTVLARLTANGQLDPAFGRGTDEARGPGWLDVRGGFASVSTVFGSGRIALAGPQCCGAKRSSVFVSRRGADGSLLGGLTPSNPWKKLRISRGTTVSSLVSLPGGRLYLVGYASAYGMFAIRLLPNGGIDHHFGRAGIARIGRLVEGGVALADRAGRLLVAGSRSGGEEYVSDVAFLTRLTRPGRSDMNWGKASFAPLTDWLNGPLALGLQSTGNVIVFGENHYECIRNCEPPGMTLLRLRGS